jgi:stearoyl-CoA desaturase (delta-9 desaturase)
MMSETLQAEPRPWEAPVWKPAEGKAPVLFYLVLVHALAAVGLVLYPLPSLPVLAATAALCLLGGLGTTVCYHRLLAHRALKLNPALEHFLVFWTIFNGSSEPAGWAANHRLHHAKADTAADVSSPTFGGFWWAHLRWLYQTPPANVKRWCPDLDKPAYRFWAHAQVPLLAASISCGLAFGWEAFFWMGAIRLVYALHMQCFVNSVTHMGELKAGVGSARNVWWLGPLQLAAWGENWHGNHHRFANSARLGLRWWQVDFGWYFIWALERVGLAWGVKRPHALERRGAPAARRAPASKRHEAGGSGEAVPGPARSPRPASAAALAPTEAAGEARTAPDSPGPSRPARVTYGTPLPGRGADHEPQRVEGLGPANQVAAATGVTG